MKSKALRWILGGAGAFFLLSALVITLVEYKRFAGQPNVFPAGGRVAGVPVDGLDAPAAEARLAEFYRLPLVLEALSGFAHLSARTGEPERAMELLTLILDHPASAQEWKDRAARLQAELTTELPLELVGAAQERGRARGLDAMVAELLSESGQEEQASVDPHHWARA